MHKCKTEHKRARTSKLTAEYLKQSK